MVFRDSIVNCHGGFLLKPVLVLIAIKAVAQTGANVWMLLDHLSKDGDVTLARCRISLQGRSGGQRNQSWQDYRVL
ncbi:MAG: hypothetical protein KUG54_00745 [Gammaproteobacteria bacterium]|nr:hypothetical protein [Gammaproteobacteria bacterium]